MTKKRPNRPRPARKRVLSDHKQERRRLIPPLLQVGPIKEVGWRLDMLPDFLWIALMMGRRSDWRAAYSALDVLDRFVPEGPRVLDGRISSFALVPPEQRAAARDALRGAAPHAIPTAFGHAVALYPECPARWLYDDWLERHEASPETGLPLLRSLVREHTNKAGVHETRLRIVAIARLVVHGRLRHPGTGVLELVPRYPSRLSHDDQAAVESVMRAMWSAMYQHDVEEHPDVAEWPRYFWARSRDLVRCMIPARSAREVVDMGEGDGPLNPEPLMLLSEMQSVLQALVGLGDTLRQSQLDAQRQPERDHAAAVLFGLASRMYRQLYAFVERPSAWAAATATLHLRPMVDTRLLSAWLIHRDDPEVFAAYREHGLGHLKLLREHIRADLGDDLDAEVRDTLERLDARVNLERDEWAQPVNLGSFTDVNARQMAIETDLKRDYDLAYAPYSSESHGEWPSVRDNDTVVCKEPLHAGHRVGAFRPPSRTLPPQPVITAFNFAREGIVAVFDHFGIDIEDQFEPVRLALEAAVFKEADEAPSDETPAG